MTVSVVFDKIKKEFMEARVAKDTARALSLGTLVGEIQTKEKSFSPARPITDVDVLAIVRKFAENASETVKLLSNLSEGRPENLETAKKEVELFSSYLPTQMSEEDIETFVKNNIALGNMGAIMAALKTNFPGQYDGKIASSVVKRVLAS